jgi:hypothetical protein
MSVADDLVTRSEDETRQFQHHKDFARAVPT